MRGSNLRDRLAGAAAGVAAMAVLAPVAAGASPPAPLDPGTRFYVPAPDSGAVKQGIDLVRHGRLGDALKLAAMVAQGHAVWFTDGSPAEVRQAVRKTMRAAALQRRPPVLVAYYLPFRDCGQYSAGGALDTAQYLAWIDAFADGIGNGRALVILEPDGLGIVPYTTNLDGSEDWCKPDLTGTGLTPATANSERYVQLNGAVDRLTANPNALVYLDATHPAWLNVGEASHRLIRAGVQRARGFFLNASNYQFTANAVAYGTWVASCIAYATEVALGDFGSCGNQYWNGGPATGWSGTAMSPYGEWASGTADPALNTAGVDSRYAGQLGGGVPATRFVVDTSRNGLGPWLPPAGVYPDPQDWCNPPDRGVGPRPTANTAAWSPYLDALLWIKVPGQSDGECFRGTAGPQDPARGIVAPGAGRWFPQQALELARLATPPLF